MKNKPLISVIIPTYNAEKYLLNSVNSVINQTIGFENIELILVDDNSSDKTKEIINELNTKYDNVVPIFLEDNSGSPSKPRNVGIKNASADYIMFLDNDDYYCSNICDTLYNTIISSDVDVVSCRNYDTYGDGKLIKPKYILDKKESMVEVNSIDEDETLLTAPSMFIWNKIYKKDMVIENNIEFPVNSLYEDVFFSLSVYMNSQKMIFLNDFFGYVYNIRLEEENKSTSQDFKLEVLLKFRKGLIKIFKLLEDNDKKYPHLEAEMLAGFTKWLLFTSTSVQCKLKIFNDIKLFYKRYNFFNRIYQVSLFNNILINMAIKIFSRSTFCFKLLLKMGIMETIKKFNIKKFINS